MTADVRGVVDFEGIGARRSTFTVDGSIVYDAREVGNSPQVGLAVQLTGTERVGLATDGSEVLGRLERVEQDLFAVVQHQGGCSLPGGNAATLTPGSQIVGALLPGGGGGGIRTALVTDSHNARGNILNSADPTAVKLMLD